MLLLAVLPFVRALLRVFASAILSLLLLRGGE
jgi:hypothetical protein